MITPDETADWEGCRVQQLASDKELREALESLGYKPDEITYAFEVLAEKKSSWAGMTDLDVSTVAAQGF
jgi:Holliday junction resolvasome RuvABC DNA-binding subunit